MLLSLNIYRIWEITWNLINAYENMSICVNQCENCENEKKNFVKNIQSGWMLLFMRLCVSLSPFTFHFAAYRIASHHRQLLQVNDKRYSESVDYSMNWKIIYYVSYKWLSWGMMKRLRYGIDMNHTKLNVIFSIN